MKDSVMSSPIAASGTSPALARQERGDDQPTLQPNLTGRFNILKFLGVAGNSFCFAALDLATGRPVKLKVLSDDAALDGVQKELFYLEAASAAKLSHQNITRATEAEELGGIHFCTVEQSPNAESLRDLLEMRSWLEVDVAVSIALQVADGLDYAHRQGVLHLNLNPASILIEGDGRVLVTDFGIGAQQGLAQAQADRSGRHRPQYASPEQIQGAGADNRSDLYSLGIVLFEMLTDRVPFDSADAGLVRKKHLSQAPHPPQLFRHGISNYLSALVLTLLEKNPDWRFQTAAQLQTALSKVVPTDSAEKDEGSFPLPEPLSDAEERQTAELVSMVPQTYSDESDAAADALPSPRNDNEAIYDEPTYDVPIYDEPAYDEPIYETIAHREVFEPPTITKIDPPRHRAPEPKARLEPSSSIPIAREGIQPFAHYVSSSRSQSKRQAVVFLAIMLVILLLISVLGRNYLPGFFLAADAGQQNNLPDPPAVVSTEQEPQTIPAEAQKQPDEPGPSASTAPPAAQEQVTPPKRKYVRRLTAGKVRQSARRKIGFKRKARKPAYLRRARNR